MSRTSRPVDGVPRFRSYRENVVDKWYFSLCVVQRDEEEKEEKEEEYLLLLLLRTLAFSPSSSAESSVRGHIETISVCLSVCLCVCVCQIRSRAALVLKTPRKEHTLTHKKLTFLRAHMSDRLTCVGFLHFFFIILVHTITRELISDDDNNNEHATCVRRLNK